jgi:hypothetical protein
MRSEAILPVLELDHGHCREFSRLIRRGNSGQQPIHLQGIGKLDHELINKAVVAFVRETGMIWVSGGICGMK